jgi:small-conductance mechanosensitive channel
VTHEREQVLIEEENNLFGNTSQINSLREARSHLDGLETRLSTVTASRNRVRQRLRLVDEQLRVMARRDTAVGSLRDVVREVGRQKLETFGDELAALDLIYTEALDVLAAQAVIAEDRLELAQSRIQVADFDNAADVAQDAKTQLVAGLIDRLLDQGLRLRLEATQMEPSTETGPARAIQLEYSGELALIRSNLRLIDLELFRLDARRASVAAIGDDPDMPVHALHEARRELDGLLSRLGAIAEEVRAENRRVTLMDGALLRRMSTAGEPVEALSAARAEVGDLRELVALQLEDINTRAAGLESLDETLGRRIDQAESEARLHRVALPGGVAAWHRAGFHALHVPVFVGTGLASAAGEIVQGRGGESGAGRAMLLIGILAIAVLTGLGLRRLVVSPANSRPWVRAVNSAAWLLVPPAAWLLIAVVAGLRPVVLASGFGLLALPAVLVTSQSLDGQPHGRRARTVITISFIAIGLWLLVMPLPLSPAVADLFDRLALLALAAVAWVIMVTAPLDGLERMLRFRLPLIRPLPPASLVYGIRLLGMAVIIVALVGIIGYAPLAGFLLSRLVGAIVVLAGVVLALAAIEMLSLGAVLLLRRQNGETSAFWRAMVSPSQRILTIIVLLAGLQAFVALFDWQALLLEAVLIAVILGTLPFTMQLVDVVVTHILAPEEERSDIRPASPRTVLMQRIGRAAVIIASALLVITLLGIDLEALSAPASMKEAVARGSLDLLVVILLADLVWQTARTILMRKEHEVAHAEEADEEADRRRARLRTLLPIGRNILAIVILVTTVLMALSSIGIEIGPLIAGAGVVGVAIGFGAQTLVRDIIAGVFFLLDDAFRIGEYIESGAVRGTVESFSLRSVKLRHHRGPLHTVPFGELSSITNYSRDWVIDKITLTVNPDSDIRLIKKLVKQIGKDMLADPELSENIIDPLLSPNIFWLARPAP